MNKKSFSAIEREVLKKHRATGLLLLQAYRDFDAPHPFLPQMHAADGRRARRLLEPILFELFGPQWKDL